MPPRGAPADSGLPDRLGKILVEEFSNDREAMRDALGVVPTTLYRYLRGETIPSRRVLSLLAERRGIDLDWLERGGEEEIQYAPQSSSSAITNLGLPMLREIADGPVTVRTAGQTGTVVAAPPTFYSEERYWYEVPRDIEGYAILEGDRLLIDPELGREPDERDEDRLIAVDRKGKKEITKLSAAEIRKAKGIRVLGAVLLVLRVTR